MAFDTENNLYLRQLLQATRNSYKACGYEQLVVAATAVGFASIPANAVYALISLTSDATGAAINYLELGKHTLPTTTTGLPKSSGDYWDVVDAANLVGFRAVQAQGGTHTLNIQYYAFL